MDVIQRLEPVVTGEGRPSRNGDCGWKPRNRFQERGEAWISRSAGGMGGAEGTCRSGG